jgi:hypothetical protein
MLHSVSPATSPAPPAAPRPAAAPAPPAPTSCLSVHSPVPTRVGNTSDPLQSREAPDAWHTAHFKMASGMTLAAGELDALPCAITSAFPVPEKRDLMLLAVVYGQRADVQRMLADEMSATAPDAQGLTPLVQAAARPDPSILQDMIAAGVDINSAQPYNGATPLIAAAAASRPDNVALLIEAGADLALATKEGQTASDVSTSPAVRMMLTFAQDQRAQNR